MKDLVFYMTFEVFSDDTFNDFEEDMMITKGFIVRNVNFADQEAFDMYIDSDEYLDFVSEMEEYGVHDFASSPVDEVWGVGYGTYEVELHNIDIVMEKWREFLQKDLNATATPVVRIEQDVTDSTDKEIYDAIESGLNTEVH